MKLTDDRVTDDDGVTVLAKQQGFSLPHGLAHKVSEQFEHLTIWECIWNHSEWTEIIISRKLQMKLFETGTRGIIDYVYSAGQATVPVFIL